MFDLPLLTILTFAPLVGVICILFVRHEDPEIVATNARHVAAFVSCFVFLISLMLWFAFDQTTADFQWVEKAVWMEDFGISYHMGVDGISVLFVMLTTLLTPICIFASWTSIKDRVKEYMICFLILETFMIGMFCALDLFLFYIFFEAVLIPMFIIIGIWGGVRRVYAAFKLFLYTLLGSVLMLVAMLTMYYYAGTTNMLELMAYDFPIDAQKWMWLAFFASFAVKVPMWPVHTWLPDAHVEAPTAGSVILAGVLLKFGGYGFLRFSLPMMPEASLYFTPLIYTLSIVAVIYTSLVALAQEDMKKLIAYSSIAHMGFVTIGTFTMTTQGIEGAIYQMLSHGVVSAALFLVVGVVYDRIHTREIAAYGGLVNRMPAYALTFMVFAMASVGLPGTGGFVGEILVLVGAFKANTWVAAFAATGVILGAAYTLYLYRRIIFGELTKENLMRITDMNRREMAIFAPLLFITIWMGIYPSSFLDFMHVSVTHLLDQVNSSLVQSGMLEQAGQ
ncbi:MAG: NADH-quinone oxidoreductase subunit M [Rhodospirillales bacterium]